MPTDENKHNDNINLQRLLDVNTHDNIHLYRCTEENTHNDNIHLYRCTEVFATQHNDNNSLVQVLQRKTTHHDNIHLYRCTARKTLYNDQHSLVQVDTEENMSLQCTIHSMLYRCYMFGKHYTICFNNYSLVQVFWWQRKTHTMITFTCTGVQRKTADTMITFTLYRCTEENTHNDNIHLYRCTEENTHNDNIHLYSCSYMRKTHTMITFTCTGVQRKTHTMITFTCTGLQRCLQPA